MCGWGSSHNKGDGEERQVSIWDVSIMKWVQWVGVLAFIAILTISSQWTLPSRHGCRVDTISTVLTILVVLVDLETWSRRPNRGGVCQDA